MRFEDLDVWKRSSRLSVSVYKELADCKNFGFKDQITRSSLSIPSNIAEGFEQSTNKDSNKFFTMPKALAVNYELKYIGIEIGYIKKKQGFSENLKQNNYQKCYTPL